MSTKSTIALVIAFVVLIGAYVVWGVTERVREIRFEQAKLVFEFQPGDVQRLVIEQDGARPVTGIRDEKTWSIERPVGVPANSLVWERVADALAGLKSQRTVRENPDDVSEYGLDPPLLAVDATLADGRTVRVTAGEKDAFQTHRYARIDDGNVILITEDNFFELNRSLLWLRDRDLVTAGERGIRRIEFLRYAQADTGNVKRGDPSKVVAAERDDESGQWMLVEPVEGVADQAMVGALVQEVRFAKGRGYIENPEDLDDYGLEVPGAGLTVYPYDGEPQSIYFGNAASPKADESNIFVRQEGRNAVFLADAYVISLFPKTPDAYLEKRILASPGSDLNALEMIWGDTDFRIEQDERERWRIVRPIEDAADAAAVSELIGGLVSIIGAGYFSSENDVFGLSKPSMLVRLEIEGQEEPVEVRVGVLRSDGRYYVNQASGGITTVSKEEIDALMLDLFYFREKRLFTFQPKETAKVSMQFRGDEYEFEVSGGLWAVRKPEGKVWETQSDMELLLSTIANARYEAIEADALPDDLAPFGLDAPTLEFRATVSQRGATPGIQEVGPIRIGDPVEEDAQLRFATIEGRSELLRVPQSIIDGVVEALRGLAEK